MTPFARCLVAGVALALAATPASATLIGKTAISSVPAGVGFFVSGNPPVAGTATSHTAIVGPGIDFNYFGGTRVLLTGDVGADSFTLTSVTAGEIFWFSDDFINLQFLNLPTDIVSVALTSSQGITDFNAANISWGDDSLTINLGLTVCFDEDEECDEIASVWDPGASATFTFTFASTPEVTVPEPASFALLAGGLVGLAALRRRRSAQPPVA